MIMGSDCLQNGIQFGKVPHERIASGCMAGADRGMLAVYLAICSMCRSWASHPSVETLCRASGLSRRGVQLALRRLEAGGHLVITPSSGRGRANTYHIVTGNSAVSSEKGRSDKDERAQSEPIKGAVSAPKTRTQSAPQQKEQKEQQQKGLGSFGPAADVEGMLRRAGIGSPKLGVLVTAIRQARMTSEEVCRIVEATRGRGGRSGLIVRALEDATRAVYLADDAEADHRRRHEGRRQAEREAELRLREQIERETADRDELLARLSPDGFGDLADAVREELPHLYRRADPRRNQGMRRAMAARILRGDAA
tara:strand:- start:3525 stop:4454 length:930 start_codon:yes stop_codon:yes gene_type:complete